MTIDEALEAIRQIELSCPDIAVKVITLDDVKDHIEDVEIDGVWRRLTDEEIRADYNWRRFGDMQEWDWEWISGIGQQ